MAPHFKFSAEDLQQIKALGLEESQIQSQAQLLRTGVSHVVLDRPCMLGDGIIALDEQEITKLARLFVEKVQHEGRVGKFVPASGAATRMFAKLAADLQALNQSPTHSLSADTQKFFAQLEKYPFYRKLVETLKSFGLDCAQLQSQGKFQVILEKLLGEDGLDFASLPKALIPFHQYADEVRTALEEQVEEAAALTRDQAGQARLHLTVASEWADAFREALAEAFRKRKENPGLWELEYSEQSPATQTIAIDAEGQPFRDAEGKLLFRPGGHGSLLRNLGELNWEMVFIKNIDNVSPVSRSAQSIHYKKALGGLLWVCREKVQALLARVKSEPIPQNWWSDAKILAQQLGAPFPSESIPETKKAAWVQNWFHRPMRVCGVVPNVGEPGGGPFCVRASDGRVTPQIVESAQIDRGNPAQEAIFQAATHFNPVDLVCLLRDAEGQRFELKNYIDPQAIFISHKTYQGRPLKALEWPGLWNGAMAEWFTLFVEVPLETFNPVKTVSDLLRPEHQELKTE